MRILFLLVVLIGIGAIIFIPSYAQTKIDGVSLVSPPREITSDKLVELQSIHAGWVAVIPYGFSRSGRPQVTYDHARQWWGERTEGTRQLIQFAKEHGMKVMLKPHVWVMGEGWTGDYKLKSEDDWKIWEHDFTKYILNHANLANSMDVELFCIGTEYRTPAKERPAFWKRLINEVRKVYNGEITYAANWDNYDQISWWDAVDYIGIDAYFPLAEGDELSVEEIKRAWIPIKEKLEDFSSKWKKKILFTEYGYQSVNGGVGKHWEIDKSRENANMEIQSNAYEALYQSLWEEEWFKGGFLWKWHLTTYGSRENKTRFTPQGKPAEKVIAKWYKIN